MEAERICKNDTGCILDVSLVGTFIADTYEYLRQMAPDVDLMNEFSLAVLHENLFSVDNETTPAIVDDFQTTPAIVDDFQTTPAIVDDVRTTPAIVDNHTTPAGVGDLTTAGDDGHGKDKNNENDDSGDMEENSDDGDKTILMVVLIACTAILAFAILSILAFQMLKKFNSRSRVSSSYKPNTADWTSVGDNIKTMPLEQNFMYDNNDLKSYRPNTAD